MNPRIPELVAELETLVHGHVEEENCIQELNAIATAWGFFKHEGPYEWHAILDIMRERLHSVEHLEGRIQDLEDELDDMRGGPDEEPPEQVAPPPRPTTQEFADELTRFRERIARAEEARAQWTDTPRVTAFFNTGTATTARNTVTTTNTIDPVEWVRIADTLGGDTLT